MKKLFIIAGLLCILPASCRNNPAPEGSADITFDTETVTVSGYSPVNSRIELLTVEPKSYSTEFNTTGVVRPVNGQMAGVAPLFDGRITRSFVRLGQQVGAGTPLFELYSAEFSEAVKNYLQSLQTKKQAESNLRRQKDLLENGVGAAREMEEAETQYEIALRDWENSETGLRIMNIDPEKTAMGQALTIVSPIAGEVVETNITVGQYVRGDSEPLAIVARLDKVWVVALVNQGRINFIGEGDKVEIRTDADPQRMIDGRIVHIGRLLDEETRSARVIIECDNAEGRLRPGMFAGVRFICAPRESIVIPSTALLQNGEQAFVFVRESEGRYIRRTVEASTANREEALITGGLRTGDVIVSRGAIYLTGN